MRSVSIAASVALALSAAPVLAQAAGAARPSQPAGQTPAAQAQPTPAVPPQAPFPQGAKIAIVNLQQIAALSNDGKAAATKINALIMKKQAEAATRQKALDDNQAKLAQGGALMNDAARAQLQRDIDKQQVDSQRFEQDAQAEVTELQNELQAEFQKKLIPILDEIRREKDLQILLSAQDAGVIAIEPGIDLTMEAVKRLDSAAAPAASTARPAPAASTAKPAPAARPAAPATPARP